MKLQVIKLGKIKLTINIERRFLSKNIIIPIGYDCHPAYMLNKLKIRKTSLPFDWLNMLDPTMGITYVTENIKNNFSSFIGDLKINNRGHVIASSYPSIEFMHEKDIITNPLTKTKLERRYQRFNRIFKENNCLFIYNIPSLCLKMESDVINFKESVFEFLKMIKKNDKLLIYIRFDENYEENKLNCDLLYESLCAVQEVSIQKYIRKLSQFGIWGNEKTYPKLIKRFDKNIKEAFPRVYIN